MFKFIKALFTIEKKHSYVFHMTGGVQVVAENVVSLTMTSQRDTGKFTAYSITWAKGKKPEFFSLSIQDIIAVTTKK